MNTLKRLGKFIFDIFFIVEESSEDTAKAKAPKVRETTAEISKVAPVAEKEETPPEVPHKESEMAQPEKEPGDEIYAPPAEPKAAPKEGEDTEMALFDIVFGPSVMWGFTPKRKAKTAAAAKREDEEYQKFKKSMLDSIEGPGNLENLIAVFAKAFEKDLSAIERDSKKVKRFGISKAIICKSRGRYRARFERKPTYVITEEDNLDALHIVDGEGRCYNNLGRATATLEALAGKFDLLFKLISEWEADASGSITDISKLIRMVLEHTKSA